MPKHWIKWTERKNIWIYYDAYIWKVFFSFSCLQSTPGHSKRFFRDSFSEFTQTINMKVFYKVLYSGWNPFHFFFFHFIVWIEKKRIVECVCACVTASDEQIKKCSKFRRRKNFSPLHFWSIVCVCAFINVSELMY